MSVGVCLDATWVPRGACWQPAGLPSGGLGVLCSVGGWHSPPQCAPGCEVLVRVRGAVRGWGRAEGAPCSTGCSSGDVRGYRGREQRSVTGMRVTGCGDGVDCAEQRLCGEKLGWGHQLKHWKGESRSDWGRGSAG